MYPHFIEVHDIRKPEDAMLINIKAIKHIYFEPETNSGAISLVDKVFVPTKESYDELKELIRNAGCHIEKGDPRLDQTKPLTKEDIKEMGVGEPVWHSNKMLWGIITNWCDLESGFCCTLVTHKSFVDMDEDDLIKYPLYRMVTNAKDINVPRKGKWQRRKGSDCWECSECHAVLESDDIVRHNYYYCYHCGADMMNKSGYMDIEEVHYE